MIIKFLAFTGPNKKIAKVEFGYGLNIIYGPSNTGKSSILDALDFMLGRESLMTELPEHDGYDQVVLGIHFSDTEEYSLFRNIKGGNYICFEGLTTEQLESVDGEVLRVGKGTKKERSLSSFIFEKLGIAERKLKINKKNQVNSLTLRNSIKLAIVEEEDIQKKGSPYFHKGFTKVTEEESRLNLFLTGVDDSNLLPDVIEKVAISNAARIEILTELVEENKNEIIEKGFEKYDPEEVKEQKERLYETMDKSLSIIQQEEQKLNSLYLEKRDLLREIENQKDRQGEVSAMLARFDILRSQYKTDIARLENIIEGGTLIYALPSNSCPYCGSAVDDNLTHEKCDEDIRQTIDAAVAEINKIAKLQVDLEATLVSLKKESSSLTNLLIRLDSLTEKNQNEIELTKTSIENKRLSYKKYLDKKDKINKFISLNEQQEALENKLRDVEAKASAKPDTSDDKVPAKLSTNSLYKLSKVVQGLLNDWGYSHCNDVHFDKETRDFVFDGKHRKGNGKGVRALMHAAATLGLMKYQDIENSFNHFGFVVLDSPLLAYEEPENEEDDLSDTDINQRFFNVLAKWKRNQVIVIENKKSIPEQYLTGEQVIEFTRKSYGRYGFFPTN